MRVEFYASSTHGHDEFVLFRMVLVWINTTIHLLFVKCIITQAFVCLSGITDNTQILLILLAVWNVTFEQWLITYSAFIWMWTTLNYKRFYHIMHKRSLIWKERLISLSMQKADNIIFLCFLVQSILLWMHTITSSFKCRLQVVNTKQISHSCCFKLFFCWT